MITPDHVREMARYNQWQNRSLYREADKLTDAQRNENRGAFFGSIHATLSHLLFGDQIWMYRFTGRNPPPVRSITESVSMVPDWDQLKQMRTAFDEDIIRWADDLAETDLTGELAWTSAAVNRELTRPKWLLVTHMFNHQTHHRGQVHCLLTGFGLKPDDTDLPFMPD